VAITSYNSLSTVATHEHVCSMLFSTYPELISGYEEPKELNRHTPATLRPTMPKNPGARTTLPEAVNPGVLGPAPRPLSHVADLWHYHLAGVCPIHLNVVNAYWCIISS
jgi:hypothetical protein